jgi:hypothetical protein
MRKIYGRVSDDDKSRYDTAKTLNWSMKIAKMRHESPVFYDPKLESWIVFRYQDVKRILSKWETFLSKIPRDLRSQIAVSGVGGFVQCRFYRLPTVGFANDIELTRRPPAEDLKRFL